ncbi:L-ribulose-5-phosphate 3-epimerase [Youxingia wuxianensis]|uniref:L-ribulose-5-phosphate 3-epimerase n=1 Tax=Youxingia wuxianensis TaxID=2763678 RepID=A0A926II28_9FIRM|nr:L-ribulose-5-phosphate 3-epimerase [Youxingia wuxianensis]MBC8585268.1 L-ribulose-5-phosphate 3-epimerase [Youxingia wuxianensis]
MDLNKHPYPLGIYEKALYRKPLWEMLDDAARAGYDNFEISLDETDMRLSRLEWSSERFLRVKQAAMESGVQIFSACFSGHRRFPLGSSDPDVEKRAMKMMEQGIRFCCELGVRVLQVAGYDVFYEPSTADTAKRYDENLAKSVLMAAKAGVMLSVEPVERYVTSVGKAMELVKNIRSPWLTVYPDTANLYMMGFDPVKELKLGEGKLAALHVREAPDDEYIPFGEGVLNFPEIFKTLKETGFSGPITVELWNEENPQYMQVVTRAREFLETIMNGE